MRYAGVAVALVAAVWSTSPWPLAALVGLAVVARQPRLAVSLALAWGLGALTLHQGLAARLPEPLNGQELSVRARVVDLVERDQRARYGEPVAWQRLWLEVSPGPGEPRWPGRHRVRVTAWGPLPALQAGDRFQGRVRLYFPHGWHNQTGPDGARFALSRRLDARGELVAVEGPVRAAGGLHAFRARLAARLRERLAGSPLGAAVIPALVAGDRRGLGPTLRERFQATGTAHLLAISGLHLTLVTGLLWWVGRWLLAPLYAWAWPPARHLALQQLAWLQALAGGLGYAALAGFSLPTQRALLMMAVLAWCRLRRRGPPAGRVLALALMAVLLVDPLAALSAGLWLSFGAVAVILLLLDGGRLPVMLALPVPMAVAGAALFGIWAWWAPLANLLLVPLFSLLVVPAALLGAVVDSGPPLMAAATGVELAVAIMDCLATWPAPSLPPAAGWGGALLLAACLLWLLPAWPWPRRLLVLCLLPWWLPDPGAPPPGRVDLVVFEVGQGQVLALRTARHLVLYDVGPAWEGGSAMARVVVPWLRRHRLRPDVTVVSHGDGDHAGGLGDLPWPGRLLAGEPGRLSAPATACRAGQHWRFDGVDFRVLWPRDDGWSGNDASCVLRVDAVGASLLLTGDITTAVEYRLLGKVAPVEVLQLAHHGSASSSADAWVRSLAPRWAVASVGYANRFHHPAPDLVARLEAAGVTVLRTDRTGMIVFRLGGLDNAALITKWRQDHGRPWHRPASGRYW
ncbi:DNA internalization-related competence protein ComEC/Rec2 [Alloalcanivorax sp. C16-2]|uniref:DNA internalization-related competence protein ComEC/Rec2 n=1 Tax=Alloalcanivorax sp. C16-2 TaxID=3390052 RepID=UPI00397054FA